MDADDGHHVNVHLLRLIATARVCLAACADVLSAEGQKFISECKNDKVKQKFEMLTGNLGLFMRDFSNTDMHMFFHRQVIHKYGKQELVDIIKKYSYIEFDKKDSEQEVRV